MVKPVNIGVKTFHELIESNSCYADKTPFIRTVFKDIASKVLLITRPRRFGKTLTLSTFYDFLVLNPENPGDVSRQENWFRGTGIFSDREFCRDYMGRFPVIFLSLQSVASDNFNDSYNQLAHAVYSLAGNFSYLESSSELNDHEIAQFKDLLNCSKLQDQSDKTALTNALLTLTDLLYRHHKINPVLLIDDYDTPLIKAARYGYYHDMVNVFFPFLSAGLRGNPHLKKAVVTGCLRAVMDLNNFQNSTVLDSGHKKLAAGIGFTEDEAMAALSCYGLDKYRDEVKRNYGGYRFGTQRMYCPRDVMSFCNGSYEKAGEPDAVIIPDDYWGSASGNDVIEEFMERLQPADADKLQDLLDGKSITAEVREALSCENLGNHDSNDFWSLLLHTGYLTFDPHAIDHRNGVFLYRLLIPNQAIRRCFSSGMRRFFSRNPVMKKHAADFIKSLFSGNAAETQEHLSSLLAKYVSVRDFAADSAANSAANAPQENYYRGFISGLLVNGVSLIKEQKSSFESEDGYIDLIIESAGNKRIIVILELKQTEDESRDKVLIARSATDHIISRKYADPYLERNDIAGIYAYGICFCKKSCSVAAQSLK